MSDHIEDHEDPSDFFPNNVEVSSDSDNAEEEPEDEKVYMKPLYLANLPLLPSTGVLGGPHVVLKSIKDAPRLNYNEYLDIFAADGVATFLYHHESIAFAKFFDADNQTFVLYGDSQKFGSNHRDLVIMRDGEDITVGTFWRLAKTGSPATEPKSYVRWGTRLQFTIIETGKWVRIYHYEYPGHDKFEPENRSHEHAFASSLIYNAKIYTKDADIIFSTKREDMLELKRRLNVQETDAVTERIKSLDI